MGRKAGETASAKILEKAVDNNVSWPIHCDILLPTTDE